VKEIRHARSEELGLLRLAVAVMQTFMMRQALRTATAYRGHAPHNHRQGTTM
jgi:hypothetical protein